MAKLKLDDSVQECGKSIAKALELLQSCARPLYNQVLYKQH